MFSIFLIIYSVSPAPSLPPSLPLRCSETMLAFFPVAARQFCSPPNLAQYKVAVMNKVEEEYKKFKGMAHTHEEGQPYPM